MITCGVYTNYFIFTGLNITKDLTIVKLPNLLDLSGYKANKKQF